MRTLTHPDALEKYSFVWTEVRLIIAAVSLVIGGFPVVYALLPIPIFFGLIRGLLALAWVVSGAASIYLLYRWNKNGQRLFGKKDALDLTAFFIAMISGINLGLTGLIGLNIGMAISSNRIVFAIVGLAYIASAAYLYRRWSESGERMFV